MDQVVVFFEVEYYNRYQQRNLRPNKISYHTHQNFSLTTIIVLPRIFQHQPKKIIKPLFVEKPGYVVENVDELEAGEVREKVFPILFKLIIMIFGRHIDQQSEVYISKNPSRPQVNLIKVTRRLPKFDIMLAIHFWIKSNRRVDKKEKLRRYEIQSVKQTPHFFTPLILLPIRQQKSDFLHFPVFLGVHDVVHGHPLD